MTKMVWVEAMDPTVRSAEGFLTKMQIWLSYGHLTVQFGDLPCVLKLATWKLDTSLRVQFTKELLGYEPKATPEKLRVASVMMLLAHGGPINSSAVAPDRRRRTLWTRPASDVGSWDHGMVWLGRQWRWMPWFVVMCHGVPRVRYYTWARAIHVYRTSITVI